MDGPLLDDLRSQLRPWRNEQVLVRLTWDSPPVAVPGRLLEHIKADYWAREGKTRHQRKKLLTAVFAETLPFDGARQITAGARVLVLRQDNHAAIYRRLQGIARSGLAIGDDRTPIDLVAKP